MSNSLWRLHGAASIFAVLMLWVTGASARGPIGFWTFNRCDGKKVADASGRGNEGQLVGDAMCVLQGPSGGSAVFNGNARIYVPDAPSLHVKRDITVAAWVKPHDTLGSQTIVNKWYAKDSFMLLVQDGRFRFTVAVPGGSHGEQLAVDAPARAGVWSHVAGTYNGTSLKLYIHGKLAAEQRFAVSRDLQQSLRPIIIGNHPSWNEFRGHIDDVILYDKVLTGSQIQALIATARPFVGEVGRIELTQNSSTQWHRVQLRNTYKSPVVVLQATRRGTDPLTLRVKSVSSNDFVFQMDEWDYLDGAHAKELIYYLVLDEGTQTLYDGTVVKAGHIDTGNAWASSTFPTPFATAPVVLTQVQTVHESGAVATRLRNVTRTGFETRVQEEEKSDGKHGSERIGYVAFAVGLGNAGESRMFEAGLTQKVVTHKPFTLLYARNYLKLGASLSTLDSVFLSAIQTFEGGDAAVPRVVEEFPAKARIVLQEEQSKDTEQTHTGEVVGYVVFKNTGDLFGGGARWTDEEVITNAGGTVTCRNSTIHVESGSVSRPVTVYCGDGGTEIPLDGTSALGPVLELGPSNLDFKKEICITLHFDKDILKKKPARYRTASVIVVRKDPDNGRTAILVPKSVNESTGEVEVCTPRLASFSVRFADKLAGALDNIDTLQVPSSRQAVCDTPQIEKLVDLENHWGMGHRTYFFSGTLAEATVFGAQHHTGYDYVWDLYNQQFSGFTYEGSGFQPAILNFGVSFYQGFGWGLHKDVLAAWGGRFVSAGLSFTLVPMLAASISGSISGFLGANEIGGLVIPVQPPGGTYGGALSIGTGMSFGPGLPVGYSVSSAVWEPSPILNAGALQRYKAIGLDVAPYSKWLNFKGKSYAEKGKALAKAILLDSVGTGILAIDGAAAAVHIGAMRDITAPKDVFVDEYCECQVRDKLGGVEKCPFTVTWTRMQKNPNTGVKTVIATRTEKFIVGNGPRSQSDWQKKFYIYGPTPNSGVEASCIIASDTEVQAYLRPDTLSLAIGDPGQSSTAAAGAGNTEETITCTTSKTK